ncbi:hypothetical protein VTI28DRAFT_1286 [Corynascus sepedonium]
MAPFPTVCSSLDLDTSMLQQIVASPSIPYRRETFNQLPSCARSRFLRYAVFRAPRYLPRRKPPARTVPDKL